MGNRVGIENRIENRKFSRRGFLKVGGMSLAGAALLGSAACGGGSDEPEGSIEVWIMQPGSDALEKLISGFANDFEKANPDTTVDLQFVPWASAHDRFVTAIGGGQVPDVAEMGTTWTPEFGALGAFMPLGENIQGQYVSSLLESGEVDGEAYGLPWYGGVRALIYRADVLDELGLEAPKTWDGIVEVGEAVKEETSLYPFGAIGTDIHQYLPMVWQAGGEIAVETSGGKWESRMNSPEAAQAFEFYAGLFREHEFSPDGALTWDSVALRSAFENGDFAMMVGGSWDVQGILASAPDLKDKLGTVLLPAGPADNRDAFAGGSHLVVFEDSENQATAKAFAEFMIKPERVNEFANELGFLPGTVAGIEASGYQRDPLLAPFPEQVLDHSRTYPPAPQWGGFEGEGIFVSAMQQIMQGDKSAEEALAEVASTMNEEFKKD
jgi:N,N'-diacetylchitobiose transport system substrate-binding protein